MMQITNGSCELLEEAELLLIGSGGAVGCYGGGSVSVHQRDDTVLWLLTLEPGNGTMLDERCGGVGNWWKNLKLCSNGVRNC